MLSWISMIFINVPISRKDRELFIKICLKLHRPVLVTGGSGLVGSAIQKIRPDWIYVDSKTYGSLTQIENVKALFDAVNPWCVIHLAGNFGGILKSQLEPFEDNILIDTYVLGEAARRQVPRVVTMTCIDSFPKKITEFYSKIITKNTKTKVTCVESPIIYGPNANFSISEGSVIPVLIHKAWIAQRDGTALEVLGSGKPVRQFIHSSDIARILVRVVEHPKKLPEIITCGESPEYTIEQVARLVADEFNIKIEFVPGPDGAARKTTRPCGFMSPRVSLKEGIKDTIQWFKDHKT